MKVFIKREVRVAPSGVTYYRFTTYNMETNDLEFTKSFNSDKLGSRQPIFWV